MRNVLLGIRKPIFINGLKKSHFGCRLLRKDISPKSCYIRNSPKNSQTFSLLLSALKTWLNSKYMHVLVSVRTSVIGFKKNILFIKCQTDSAETVSEISHVTG